MKELTIEQKAKRYDEAIKKLRSLHDNYDTVSTLIDVKEELENIIPELAESEDERIRKRLISYFKSQVEAYKDGNPEVLYTYNKWIAWLEKQGEKDKLIKELGEYKVKYTQEVLQGEQKSNPCENCIIATNNCQNFPCTIRDGEQKPTIIPKFKVGDIIRHKEQGCTCKITAIDTATAEYGVSECSGTHLPFDFQDAWELVEQKPAEWSEDDEEMIDSIIGNIKYLYSLGSCDNATVDKKINWLKSLTNRALSQPKQEWSEEDEKTIHLACEFIRHHSNRNDSINGIDCPILIERLKFLRPQSHWKPSYEQMENLSRAFNGGTYRASLLMELYQDLKKLKGIKL